jgi:hypothetical protein
MRIVAEGFCLVVLNTRPLLSASSCWSYDNKELWISIFPCWLDTLRDWVDDCETPPRCHDIISAHNVSAVCCSVTDSSYLYMYPSCNRICYEAMLIESFVTVAWPVLVLRMKDTTYRYSGKGEVGAFRLSTTPWKHIRICIQKLPDWPPGARTANGTTHCHLVQLYAILWVSLVSFAAVTLCVASQRMYIVVSLCFVIDSVWKLCDTPWYHYYVCYFVNRKVREPISQIL